MKRLLIFLLALTLAVSSCGLGGKDKDEDKDTETDTEYTSENDDIVIEGESDGLTDEERAEKEAAEKEAYEKALEENNAKASKGETVINITSPEKANRYETGAISVVIFGEILNPENVASVEVNGFKLRKYYPGNKEFNYIAAINIATMKRGENNYSIEALDKEGNVLATTEYTIVSSVIYANLSQTGFESYLFAIILSAVAYMGWRKGYVRV